VSGAAAVAYDVSSISDHDLLKIVPLVLFLIGVLLALVLRSLVAPVYLILSVALSYFAALGVAVILFDWIGGADGLNFVLPFLMFVFLMALGEDYNILVMTRIREEAGRRPLREAIATALRATGASVTSAGLVLAATFAVAGVSGATSQVRQLATAISLGILLDTFPVRTLLVPATVALVGRWELVALPPAGAVELAPAPAGGDDLGDDVDLQLHALGRRLAPHREVRRGHVGPERGLVLVDLVEEEAVRVGGVDADVELQAAGLPLQRGGALRCDRREEPLPEGGPHVEGHEERDHAAESTTARRARPPGRPPLTTFSTRSRS